ncbi:Gfo/Idh/MocA family oxidoreductase [Chryseolinea sp. H1M3-3]|uniref:Gfo/Idh/MocA family protein n=1 Tax=Chryseolinea sp. H1M3-3 TaxID=3034144 RepID=UPI0023ED2C4C|nr:Gfo/Idh/MocA family oxidoreductase [Chryseolinea sp. H1M3-3]
MNRNLRFAVIGTGFWANYQIPAWMELEGVELVALYNRTKPKAEALAHKFKVPRVYEYIEDLLKNEKLDFVDIITDVDTHAPFTEMAAKKNIAVICQKPMASKLHIARQMVDVCKQTKTPFYIHENWRWQAPIRKFKEILDSNIIGKPFKARVTFCSRFPVFDNQPFLAELNEFILTDIGSHILDVCRFLFGEARTLQCHTSTVNSKIKGEDVANVFMKMHNGMTCYAEMSYASILEYEPFPQTFILVEGAQGSIHLTKEYELHVTTQSGTDVVTANPTLYSWVDPKNAMVHSSIVDCNRNLLNALTGKAHAETTGEDNFETVRLVHASYASAKTDSIIDLQTF